jgi:hypothetical protein
VLSRLDHQLHTVQTLSNDIQTSSKVLIDRATVDVN